jgi:hypothetical protein
MSYCGESPEFWEYHVAHNNFHAFLLHPVCVNVLGYYNVRLTQHTILVIYFYFLSATCFGLFVRPSSGKSDKIVSDKIKINNQKSVLR